MGRGFRAHRWAAAVGRGVRAHRWVSAVGRGFRAVWKDFKLFLMFFPRIRPL